MSNMFFFLNSIMLKACTLWNKSLCPSGEDMSLVALQLDTSLLGKGSPVMYLKDT